MFGGFRRLRHKEATNQSLNQKSRCFYIGAFSFYPLQLLLSVTAPAHAADQHLYLLTDISARQLYRRDRHLFETNRITTDVANEVHMIIAVMPTGTFVFAQRISYGIIRGRYAMDQSFFQEGLQRTIYRNPIELPGHR
jgi:hypothetical protein